MVRLDPTDDRVKLRLQPGFIFPLDVDLSVRTRVARPEAVRRLLLLQLDAEVPEGTSVGLRLHDGTGELWWDGAAWTTPAAGEWNTVAEVNVHVTTFPVTTNRAFAVVLNLLTTDEKVTPTVSEVLVLWEGDVDWVADALLDSLTATFQEDATFTADLALPPLPTTVTSIDLDAYRDEAELTFAGAEAVYDHAADPEHLINLLSSYNPTTRVLTLTAPGILATGVPFLRMRARAQVAWDTNQDWAEVGKLPQVVLRDAETLISSSYPMSAARGIIREDTGAGVLIPPPMRTTYRITMEVRINRSREQERLLTVGPTGEVGPFLRVRSTDERYRIWLVSQFNAMSPGLEDGDVRSFQMDFRIEDVRAHLRPAEDRPSVQRLKMNWAQTSSEAEQDALLRGSPVPSTAPETYET